MLLTKRQKLDVVATSYEYNFDIDEDMINAFLEKIGVDPSHIWIHDNRHDVAETVFDFGFDAADKKVSAGFEAFKAKVEERGLDWDVVVNKALSDWEKL